MSSREKKIAPTFRRGDECEWEISSPGVWKKTLRADAETGALAFVLRFEADSTYPLHTHPGGEEIFALEGEIKVGAHTLRPGDYLYTPPDGVHAVTSKTGAVVFLRLDKQIEIVERREP